MPLIHTGMKIFVPEFNDSVGDKTNMNVDDWTIRLSWNKPITWLYQFTKLINLAIMLLYADKHFVGIINKHIC